MITRENKVTIFASPAKNVFRSFPCNSEFREALNMTTGAHLGLARKLRNKVCVFMGLCVCD